mmetsp:Transcript_39788/g.96056  ORF Transcript_39788/g.96056 Transcript_39788/m.96056 type:complete len:502 (-) Transcript_39788:48-1553(-)
MKDTDVWLEHENHPGTKEFRRILREIITKEGNRQPLFSRQIYQRILDQLDDHNNARIYVDDSEQGEPRPMMEGDDTYDRVKKAYEQELDVDKGSSTSQPPKSASPLPTLSATPTKVGEYWFDKLPWVSGESYRIREFVEKPPIPYFQRNEGFGRELFFFFCLLFLGTIILGYYWSLLDKRELFASMFFASGLIPGIQLLLFDVLPREFGFLRNRNSTETEYDEDPRAIRVDNSLTVGLSVLFLSIAVSIYPEPEEDTGSWDIACGRTLFEAGLIYFVTRVLFFVPNPNDEIRQLQRKVRKLKQSMATGLADGYFWNLVKEIAMDIRDANGPEKTLKLTYPREGENLKKVKRFLVLLPRSLDWTQEDPIKSLIQQYKDSGHFKDCKIEKSPLRSESTRVKWVTDVLLPTIDGSAQHPYGILMDLPTTITSLVMDLKADQVLQNVPQRSTQSRFEEEVSLFAYRLAWQLKRHQLEAHVAVVEIENPDHLLDKIREVDEALNNN